MFICGTVFFFPKRSNQFCICSYPVELHIVHYNANYGSLEKAVNYRDGLAVMAVLFEETERDNANFQPIIDSFDNISLEGMKAELSKEVEMVDFLPKTESFFRYAGSLVISLSSVAQIVNSIKRCLYIDDANLSGSCNLDRVRPAFDLIT